MAKPKDPVAADSAAPHRTVFRPALRSYEQTFDQALCHPPVVRDERQINVDQRVGFGEPLPGRINTAKAVNDPLVLAQQVRMRLQVLLVRNFAATSPILDGVQRVQWQPSQICQTLGKCRFSTAGVSEYRDSFHRARSVDMSRTRSQDQNRQISLRA